ncbi:MAG TPA: hypothetical protein VM889_14965 [Candidatus Thermoplasmatota archaeon]|nr:hypothetical protein [Candidatus Thermoplasmatota archaeon]
MKKKGEKLPSISIEGQSNATTVFRDGRIVKVCPTCASDLDRASGRCPKGH